MAENETLAQEGIVIKGGQLVCKRKQRYSNRAADRNVNTAVNREVLVYKPIDIVGE